MRELLREAVEQKRRLTLFYTAGDRLIEPHAFGVCSNGHLLVRAYQVSGASESGEHEHWKLFRVDRMSSLADAGQTFDEPRPGYRRGDKAMRRIIAQL